MKTRDMGICEFVRTSFVNLIENNIIVPEMAEKLTDKKYCKNTFGINYPFLKPLNDHQSISEQAADHNGRGRFLVKPVVTLYGQRYIICNHWIDAHWTKYRTWLEKHGDSISSKA